MIAIVDASAVLELLLQTSAAPAVTRRLFGRKQVLCAPHLIDLEVLQVLRRYVRTRQIAERRATDAVDDYLTIPITRYPHIMFLRRMWEFRHNMTAYDAAYVTLAEALDAPLLTPDSRLAATTRYHKAKIELI